MSDDRAAVYVHVGPFDSKEQAQHFVETLRALSATSYEAARARIIPGRLGAALDAGLQHLCAMPGHFQIRVDGNPEVGAAHVRYAAEGRKKESA